MPESEERTVTDGVDCSGATEADALSKLKMWLNQEYTLLVDNAGARWICHGDLIAFKDNAIKQIDTVMAEKAVADDAGESGVQETERSLLDEAINCLRDRESLLDGRVHKYRHGNGPEWIADMWGNRHEETGMCVNELVKLKQNLQAKPNNTDKGLDARRSEVS